MMAQPMTKAEAPKYWPDEDARTITRAQEILNDPKRKADCVKELKKQATAAAAALAHAQAVKDVKGAIDSVFGKGK
jgi:hypothetical protein